MGTAPDRDPVSITRIGSPIFNAPNGGYYYYTDMDIWIISTGEGGIGPYK